MPLTDFCDKIAAGFDPCSKSPSVAGIEPSIYAFNMKDFTISYSAQNPLIATGITRIGSAVMYKIKGNGDSFNAISKPSKKQVGPRFAETVEAYISDNTSAGKQFLMNALTGRIGIIVINNDKTGDGGVELYGAVCGLQLTDNSQRDAQDENMQGARKLEFTNPPKLTEPYPPRSVFISPSLFGSATYYYKVTALTAAGETIGSAEGNIVTTASTTSVSLAWPAITGATSYKVYRGTAAGAENLYYTTATNSYTDSNLSNIAGTVPVANTAAIPAPSTPGLTNITTGGTLAAATYYYKVTALTAAGETIGSSESSVVTTGATSSVGLAWPAVAGATSYKVYRGTASAGQNTYYASAGTSFTDTGAAGTAGTVPVANTANVVVPSVPTAAGSTAGAISASYASTIAVLESFLI